MYGLRWNKIGNDVEMTDRGKDQGEFTVSDQKKKFNVVARESNRLEVGD